MDINKEEIKNIKYIENPDYLLGVGCLTHYKDIFLKVLLKDYDFFDKFGSNSLTVDEISTIFNIKKRALYVF